MGGRFAQSRIVGISRYPLLTHASFRGDATIRSLSERNGHLASRASRLNLLVRTLTQSADFRTSAFQLLLEARRTYQKRANVAIDPLRHRPVPHAAAGGRMIPA